MFAAEFELAFPKEITNRLSLSESESESESESIGL
jgi:hypothetical protein